MTRAQLQERCKSRGLIIQGTKAEIIDRLQAADGATPDTFAPGSPHLTVSANELVSLASLRQTQTELAFYLNGDNVDKIGKRLAGNLKSIATTNAKRSRDGPRGQRFPMDFERAWEPGRAITAASSSAASSSAASSSGATTGICVPIPVVWNDAWRGGSCRVLVDLDNVRFLLDNGRVVRGDRPLLNEANYSARFREDGIRRRVVILGFTVRLTTMNRPRRLVFGQAKPTNPQEVLLARFTTPRTIKCPWNFQLDGARKPVFDNLRMRSGPIFTNSLCCDARQSVRCNFPLEALRAEDELNVRLEEQESAPSKDDKRWAASLIEAYAAERGAFPEAASTTRLCTGTLEDVELVGRREVLQYRLLCGSGSSADILNGTVDFTTEQAASVLRDERQCIRIEAEMRARGLLLPRARGRPGYQTERLLLSQRNVKKQTFRFMPNLMPELLKTYDGGGLVYMTLPAEGSSAGLAEDNRFRLEWCSCDEGLNTFITITDLNTGVVYTVGEDVYKEEMFPLLRRADELKGRAAKWLANGTPERPRAVRDPEYVTIRKAMLWCNEQARAVADKIHSAAIRLLSGFNLIILARLPVSQMVQRAKSSARTNRGLLAMRISRFHDKLMRRAAFIGLDRMRILDAIEPHSSHACCGCGRLFGSLGYSRVFQCSNEECALGRHASSGRDSNASRGIGLLNLGLLALQLFGQDAFAGLQIPRTAEVPPSGHVQEFGQLTEEQLEERTRFFAELNNEGFEVREMPHDNLCFFSSLAAQLPGDHTALAVRDELLQCMREDAGVRDGIGLFIGGGTSYTDV